MNPMTFEQLISQSHDILRGDGQAPQAVLQIRSLLKHALACDAFVLDCVGRILASMSTGGSDWSNPPLYEAPDGGYSVRMVYWPPHYANNPHEHRTWTVTGVVLNSIQVRTYTWSGEPGASDLTLDKTLVCQVGEVGYILPPCVHSVLNSTDNVSMSIHMFSNTRSNGGEMPPNGDETIWYPAPEHSAIRKGVTQRAVVALIGILSQVGSSQCIPLLDLAFRHADHANKLRIAQVLGKIDPEQAAYRLLELADISSSNDAKRLREVSSALLRRMRS